MLAPQKSDAVRVCRYARDIFEPERFELSHADMMVSLILPAMATNAAKSARPLQLAAQDERAGAARLLGDHRRPTKSSSVCSHCSISCAAFLGVDAERDSTFFIS